VWKQRGALTKEGNGKVLSTHLSKMREMNRDVFFDIDMDDDNRIKNVF